MEMLLAPAGAIQLVDAAVHVDELTTGGVNFGPDGTISCVQEKSEKNDVWQSVKFE
jgi:hypothetical protein